MNEIINKIIIALRKAGYHPYEQLVGYVKTGSSAHITRKNNARAKAEYLGVDVIKSIIPKIKNNKLLD